MSETDPPADQGTASSDTPASPIVDTTATPLGVTAPDVFLRVDRRTVPLTVGAGDVLSCRLDEIPADIWLVSSSMVPFQQDPELRDRRRLGVPLRQIVLHTATARVELPHNSMLLSIGFHASETSYRWTDGYARIPPVILKALQGALTIEVHLVSQRQRYPGEVPTDWRHPADQDGGAPRRALFVDARIPTPDRDAGSNVIIEQMRVIQSMGFAATFLTLESPFPESHALALLHEMDVEVAQTSTWNDVERFLAQKGGSFDLCYLHRFDVAERCLPVLRYHAPATTILFNNADMHFLRAQRALELGVGSLNEAQIAAIERRELAVSSAADCTILCNTAEQAILRAHIPDAVTHFLPWVIEPRVGDIPSMRARDGLMFLGGFNHPPNLDAVAWFISEVAPLIHELLPGLRLYIYGSDIPESLQILASDTVVIEGHVDDLADAFDRHRVNLVPLRYGAGFKGKLASALNHGVPSVVTPIGIEGTGLTPMVEVLEASDPVSFAAAVLFLYTSEHCWDRLSTAGRRHVEEHLSPERARRHFEEIFAACHLHGPFPTPAA